MRLCADADAGGYAHAHVRPHAMQGSGSGSGSGAAPMRGLPDTRPVAVRSFGATRQKHRFGIVQKKNDGIVTDTVVS